MMNTKTLVTSLAVAVVATIASNTCASIIYLDTDFDEVDVAGPVQVASLSPNNTGLVNTGNGAANTTIEENFATAAADTEPTGQHLRIDGNRDKHVSMANAMTLLSDGVSEFDISFSFLLSGNANQNRGRVQYSALGDFSDTVLLANYVFTGSSLINAGDATQTVVNENTWTDESITVTNTDVTFTDTAKVRFAQDEGGAISTGFYLDDISITAVPEPGSLALLGLGGLLIARRRRG